MTVWFIPLSAIDPTDEYADEHIDHYVQPGTLTTDHPASSYGLPVIIGLDGTPYGPGDIYGSGYAGACKAPRRHDLESLAAAAGFVRESNYSETATTY